MAGVSVRDVKASFGSTIIFEKLSIEIGEGEFVVLLGPSGCGKSTLLNAIAGLIDIDDGEIWIGARNVTWEEPKDRGLGMVFQSYSLYPRMNVEQNLSFGLRIAGVKCDEIASRVERTAKLLQLGDLLKRRPAELSGGQRQRVAIGRALIRDVGLFLFDEPLSNLDAKLRNELRVEIKKLHQDVGATMIYVTHDQIEALTLADRIAVMKGGQIQQFASPREIYNKPANLFVAEFVGAPAMNRFAGHLKRGANGFRFESAVVSVDLADYQALGELTETPAMLGVRPEHFRLAPPPGAPSLSGRVTVLEPMGGETIVWLDANGASACVKAQGDVSLQVGENVKVGFELTRVHVFDAGSGARL